MIAKNTSRIVLAALVVGMLAGQAPAAKKSPSRGSLGDEWGYLKNQMASLKTWNYDRVARETFHPEAMILKTDKTPVDIVLRRTAALLADVRQMDGAPDLKAQSAALAELKAANTAPMSESDQKALFARIVTLRRKIAFANPLLDFDKIIFLKHHKQGRGEIHMVDQYLGFNMKKGGGVYVLENAFSDKPTVRSLLGDKPVKDGRLKGKILEDKGSFISLDLDYDGKTILFAFTEAEDKLPSDARWDTQSWTKKEHDSRGRTYAQYHWRPDSSFHIFKANADGTGLVQLTDSQFNEYDPCFLPNGRIVFISERIGGNQRCGARWAPTAALSAMMPDGSDIIPLSYHDTNEWHPSVDNNGMIVYTRWDYIDRDSDIAHHIWHCYPDGRDPRSFHGNYPKVRESRPWMEMSIRSIPNSHRYVAVTAGHHGQNYGSLITIDCRETDDRSTSQLKRLTPEVYFSESEVAPGVIKYSKGKIREAEVFSTPWPLSEKYYLAVFDPGASRHAIALVDCFGNREVLYQDKGIPCLDPIPFRARKRPPAIPIKTIQARADRVDDSADLSTGTVSVMNIYESELPFPKGTKITEMRVVAIFPKPNAFLNKPNIGHAAQSLCRGVLGTVPVESDGSVYFTMPTGCAVYFQAIDDRGLAVHTMRSETYLHPGETLSCIGCHEDKNATFKRTTQPLALKRAPSKLKREAPGAFPLTFPRLVQPVLDARCVTCHDKEKKAPSLRGDKFAKHGWSDGMTTLNKYAWGMAGGNGAIRRNGRSYSIPTKDGALVSKLYGVLTGKEHTKRLDGKLTSAEFRRITMWLDCNSNFYGAYVETEAQAAGKVVKPKLGLPKWTKFEDLVH